MRLGQWNVEVENLDGQFAQVFAQDGRPEVWIFGRTEDGLQHVVLPVQFASIELAEQAGRILRDALEQVEALRLEEAPPANDGHDHRLRFVWFQRALPGRAVCEICNTDLGEVPRRPGG